MITLARKNALKAQTSNVSFIHSTINNLPLASNSIDCVISNCVLNLVPEGEKPAVFAAIHRVLKPGGRLAVSDFLAYKPLPQDIRDDPALQVGCVSGASTVPRMRELLASVGFTDAMLVDTKKDLNLYKDGEDAVSVTPCCSGETACGPMRPSGRKRLDYDLNEWIGMYLKPYDLSSSSPPSPASQEGHQLSYSPCETLGAFQIYALKTNEDAKTYPTENSVSIQDANSENGSETKNTRCCGGKVSC